MPDESVRYLIELPYEESWFKLNVGYFENIEDAQHYMRNKQDRTGEKYRIVKVQVVTTEFVVFNSEEGE